jgi:D-alanyl-D-alanine dipeptidase
MTQITKSLPRVAWESVTVQENGEVVLPIPETTRLKLGWVKKQYEASFTARKTAVEKLLKASESLPEGLVLVVVEGVRTLDHQRFGWNSKWEHVKAENPTWSDEQIEKAVRLVVAKPAPLANHNCGGAVDVVLGRVDGTLVDMGAPYPSHGSDMDFASKFPMLSLDITDEQKANRKILREAMESQGFVWYPGEWWHFCYGDRMWAVYTSRTECGYGPLSY